MAGRPLRRARLARQQMLASEESRRAQAALMRERRGQTLRAGGMILLTLVLVSWYLAWATAQVLFWCGMRLATFLNMEDLFDKMPGHDMMPMSTKPTKGTTS